MQIHFSGLLKTHKVWQCWAQEPGHTRLAPGDTGPCNSGPAWQHTAAHPLTVSPAPLGWAFGLGTPVGPSQTTSTVASLSSTAPHPCFTDEKPQGPLGRGFKSRTCQAAPRRAGSEGSAPRWGLLPAGRQEWASGPLPRPLASWETDAVS